METRYQHNDRVAQLEERYLDVVEVAGSIPVAIRELCVTTREEDHKIEIILMSLEGKALNARDSGCVGRALAYEDALYQIYKLFPQTKYVPSAELLVNLVSAKSSAPRAERSFSVVRTSKNRK